MERFCAAETAQSKELKEQSVIATRNDYATVEGNEKSNRFIKSAFACPGKAKVADFVRLRVQLFKE